MSLLTPVSSNTTRFFFAYATNEYRVPSHRFRFTIPLSFRHASFVDYARENTYKMRYPHISRKLQLHVDSYEGNFIVTLAFFFLRCYVLSAFVWAEIQSASLFVWSEIQSATQFHRVIVTLQLLEITSHDFAIVHRFRSPSIDQGSERAQHWPSFHQGFKLDQNIRTNQLQSSIPLLQSNDRGMLDWLVLTFWSSLNPWWKLGLES